ncbi:MAG: Na/Pi cotransporter family protein [Lachnospiraceae bacterium]|nr:Na/Pi cotransporter family protein [Lachnospiraceae bacterium]
MSIFDVLTLAGGLAMFLYGMRLMGDGLKASSSGTLKRAMERVTNNPVKAFLLGMGVTAIIQSSTATIVITSGLVGAGLLTLHQSLGIVIGANVGTTVTGQIIRLLDMDASAGSWLQIFKPSSLAPIALIIGIVLIMGKSVRNSRQIGNIAIGFGILFSGLLNMTSAVTVLTESDFITSLFEGLGENPLIGYITGAGVAFVLQSSSAAIGILQAFSQSGLLTFKAVYPVIVGIYLGDCVTTAIVCWIGAKADAKRIGIVNILFNIGKTVLVLAGVGIAHSLGLINDLWDLTVNSGIIANANSIFNLACAALLFPTLPLLEKLGRRLVPDDVVPDNKYKEKLDALSPAFFRSPALALRSCYNLLLTQVRVSRSNIEKAFSLFDRFDTAVFDEIMEEEENIDLMTDALSKYMVELLPFLESQETLNILNQYYKVVTEFERLGDHAVNIAENAAEMSANQKRFSETASHQLHVLEELLQEVLENTERAFEKRDVDAAFRIEPLDEVVSDMINTMKMQHLDRMGRGECNIYADANFENLMTDLRRIAAVCTNVGQAIMIRVNPDLQEKEHGYFSELHSGRNEEFNRQYNQAYERYFGKIGDRAAG